MLQFARERNVLNDHVLDDDQRSDLFSRQLKGARFNMLTRFHDLLGALQGNHLFERFVNSRGDQALKRIAIISLKQLDHRSLRNTKEHAQLDLNLLQVRRITLGFILSSLLTNRDGMNRGDQRGLQSESFGLKSR